MSQSNQHLGDEIRRPFEKPWHADLFATTVHLTDQNLFSWSDWTLCFGKHLGDAKLGDANLGDAIDGGDDYYQVWLDALIEMHTVKNITNPEMIEAMQNRWAVAHDHHSNP